MRLVACHACRELVRVDERRCIHCGAPLRWTFARLAMVSAAAAGLSLFTCEAAAATTTGTDGSSTSDTSGSTGGSTDTGDATGSGEGSTNPDGTTTMTEDASDTEVVALYGVEPTCSVDAPADPATATAALVLLLLGFRRRD